MSENESGTTGAAQGKTYTQKDLDDILREVRKNERAKFGDYDDLKAKAAEGDKNKSALDKLLEKFTGLEERTAKAEKAALRAEVATAKKLPAWMAKRLTGDTREELEADADEMLRESKPPEGDGKSPEGEAGKAGEGKTEGDGVKSGDGKSNEGKAEGKKLPPSGRPTERLTAGAAPASTSEKSPAQLAEEILKSGF